MVVPAFALASSAGAAAGGNKDGAHTCQDGGWQDWVRADQTPFKNEGDCASYAAQGGTLTAPLPDLCISANGVVLVQRGSATCSSVPGEGNLAIATGDHAAAYGGLQPGDDHDQATATGVNAVALTAYGDNNSARAEGTLSTAGADDGNNNTATATGDGAHALANFGDNNTATANGGGAQAQFGDNNTATATGFASAFAGQGNNNTATATASASGPHASATAAKGNNNTAIANGDGSFADAEAPDGCTVTNGTCP
jgi:hypothetical protein